MPPINAVDLLIGQDACVNRTDDFASDRKHGREPFHLGLAVARAIQVNDEAAYVRLVRPGVDRAQGSLIQLQPGMSSFKWRRGQGAEFIGLHLWDLGVVCENPLAIVNEGGLRQT
jgi:hypothetical protein